MIKRIKKWWRQQKLRRKLGRMERVLHLSLTSMQRVLILDPNQPKDLHRWPRRSGKTTCACLHLLLHAPITACYSSNEAMRLLEDPDKFLNPQVRRWTYLHLYEMCRKFHDAGIRTCVLLPPMPGAPDGYVGHGRYDGHRKER